MFEKLCFYIVAAISAALSIAGTLELLHSAALRGACGGRFCVFSMSWCHELWFTHILGIGLLFIGHPEAPEGIEVAHVTAGLCFIFGAHAATIEKTHGFDGQAYLVNPSIDPLCQVRDTAYGIGDRGTVEWNSSFFTVILGDVCRQDSLRGSVKSLEWVLVQYCCRLAR